MPKDKLLDIIEEDELEEIEELELDDEKEFEDIEEDEDEFEDIEEDEEEKEERKDLKNISIKDSSGPIRQIMTQRPAAITPVLEQMMETNSEQNLEMQVHNTFNIIDIQ